MAQALQVALTPIACIPVNMVYIMREGDRASAANGVAAKYDEAKTLPAL